MNYKFDDYDSGVVAVALLKHIKDVDRELEEAKAYIARLESTKDGAFFAVKESIDKRKQALADDLASIDAAIRDHSHPQSYKKTKTKRLGRPLGSKNKPKGKSK